MRKVCNGLLIVSLSLSLCFPVYGGVYKWVDGEGKVHFTDDLSKVPQGGKKEEVNVSNDPLSVFSSSAPPSVPAGEIQPARPETPDETKKGEESAEQKYRQSLLNVVRNDLQEKRQAKEKLETELMRPKYKQMVRSERLLRTDLEKLNHEIKELEAREKEIQADSD